MNPKNNNNNVRSRGGPVPASKNRHVGLQMTRNTRERNLKSERRHASRVELYRLYYTSSRSSGQGIPANLPRFAMQFSAVACLLYIELGVTGCDDSQTPERYIGRITVDFSPFTNILTVSLSRTGHAGLVMSPLRRHIFVCFLAKWFFFRP